MICVVLFAAGEDANRLSPAAAEDEKSRLSVANEDLPPPNPSPRPFRSVKKHSTFHRRKKSSTGRRRSSVTAGRVSGGLDGSGSSPAAGAEGPASTGDAGVFGEDGEEGECWHELKDEDGSGWFWIRAAVCVCNGSCRCRSTYFFV